MLEFSISRGQDSIIIRPLPILSGKPTVALRLLSLTYSTQDPLATPADYMKGAIM